MNEISRLALLALTALVPLLWMLAAHAQGRQLLTSPVAYYLRSDGNDTCNGLVNAPFKGSTGGNCAFASPEKAVSVLTGAIDFGGQTVTLTIGDGSSFTAPINLNSSTIGGGSLVIDFGGGGINSAAIAVSVTASCGSTLVLQNGTLQTSVASDLSVSAPCKVNFGNPGGLGSGLVFGQTGPGGYHMQATANGASIEIINSNYAISGGGEGHILAADGGRILGGLGKVTCASGLSFSNAFAYSIRLGLVSHGGTNWSGCEGVLGKKFDVEAGGTIDQTGDPGYFPGSLAGVGTSYGAAPYGLYR